MLYFIIAITYNAKILIFLMLYLKKKIKNRQIWVIAALIASISLDHF